MSTSQLAALEQAYEELAAAVLVLAACVPVNEMARDDRRDLSLLVGKIQKRLRRIRKGGPL